MTRLPHSYRTYDACDDYAPTKHTHKTQHLGFRDAGHEVKRTLSEAMAHVEAVAHLGACLLRASHLPIGRSSPGHPPVVLGTSWQLLPRRNVRDDRPLSRRLLLRWRWEYQGGVPPGHVLPQGGRDMGRHVPAVSVCGGKPLPGRMPDGEGDYLSPGYILKHVGDLQLRPMRAWHVRQCDGCDRVLTLCRGRHVGGECLCVYLWSWLRGRRIRAVFCVCAGQGHVSGSRNMPGM
jgi:hypothetical protein